MLRVLDHTVKQTNKSVLISDYLLRTESKNALFIFLSKLYFNESFFSYQYTSNLTMWLIIDFEFFKCGFYGLHTLSSPVLIHFTSVLKFFNN